jgi:zinc transport system substrate-binding protein
MRYTISFILASLTATPALADVPDVVTDIPPVHALVAQVMGDLGQPVLLLDKGADAHDFALRPSQAAAVEGADLLFWIGPGMTPWLERAIAGTGVKGKVTGLLDAPGVHLLTFAEEGATGGDLAEKLEEHGPVDPHAWLDPANAKIWLDLIAADLAAADAEHASIYTANAGAAKAGIDALTAEVKATMAPVGSAPVVLFHDAYAYYAAAFGLNIAGTISESDAARPGAARIAEVQGVLAGAKAVCIFPETNHDPKYVATVTEGADVKVGGALDPEGSSYDPGPGLYAALLRGLAQTLAECVTRAP